MYVRKGIVGVGCVCEEGMVGEGVSVCEGGGGWVRMVCVREGMVG